MQLNYSIWFSLFFHSMNFCCNLYSAKKHLSALCLFISFVCLLVCLVICECHLTISCVCCNNACICLMPALFTLFVVIAFGCKYVSLVICWPACLFATSPFAASVCHFIYVSVSKKPLTCLLASFLSVYKNTFC